jgi:hypothetical protein
MLPLLLALCGCAYVPKPPPLGSTAPVLEAWYASPQATWGETWKVYLKAHDADGDLWEARFHINQLGVTYDSADSYSVLNQECWNGFDGYFFLRIPDRNLWSGRISLVMSVVLIDRGGLKSQEILVPLKVGSKPGGGPPPGFADRPIAPIRHVLRPS